jgi:hypothetical protein
MTKPTGKPTGRPKGVGASFVTADQLPLIEEMAARGCNEITIARACGIRCNKAWQKAREAQPEVADALASGRAVEHDMLVSKLHTLAMGGNAIAAMFLLKCRHGYREGEAQAAPQLNVTISLPGAMAPENYEKVIGHGTTESQQLPSKRLKRS